MSSVSSQRRQRVEFIRRLWQENEWLYFVVGTAVGLIAWPALQIAQTEFADFLYDLVPEAVGIVFTVVIIDRLNQMREQRQFKEQLMRQMHSRYSHMALTAVEELRVLGYLSDGSLVGRNLRGANLREANLYQADLRESDLTNTILGKADLVQANLEDAQITDKQLMGIYTMHGATMPDGSRYNGRFNLEGDFKYAQRYNVNVNSPEAMSKWYDVSLEDYMSGQIWAKENLGDLRDSTGQ